jgi:coenzyme F420-reducing hydrogenase delta subunit
MTSIYHWDDVIKEVTGKTKEVAPSPWDALTVRGRAPTADRVGLATDDVDLSIEIATGSGKTVLKLPIVLTDNSRGKLAPHARLALVQAAARRGCALRLPDPTPDILELSGELGIPQWVVLGPHRTGTAVRALDGAEVVELQVMELDEGGGVSVAVDSEDNKGSMAATVDTLRSVSGGAFIVVNVGGTTDPEVIRRAVASGADGIMVQALSRRSSIGVQLAGSGPMASIASVRRAMSRAKFPKGTVRPRILISGGFKDGFEVAKAMALGADLVVMGSAPRVALGCGLCDCDPGDCPVQDGGGEAGKGASAPDWKSETKSLVVFLDQVTHRARSILAQMGCANVDEATMDMLEARSYDVAAITGVALAGYGEVLPMWLH